MKELALKHEFECAKQTSMAGDESPILFIKALDDALVDVGVQPGDMLVIDRSKKPLSGDIVLVQLNERVLVNRLSLHFGKAYLIPENSKYKIISVGAEDYFNIIGVLIQSIRSQVISHIKPRLHLSV